ncbi:MAG: hypothetical protein M1546_05125, partial [Chloroflexi bacterium]|nr:hypothetical protein [Chloroflexota bacterium]
LAIAINFGGAGIAQAVSVQAVAAPLQISSTTVMTTVDSSVPAATLPPALPGAVSTETLDNPPTPTPLLVAPVAQAIAVPAVNSALPFTNDQRLEGFEGDISIYIIEDEDGGNRQVYSFLNEQPLDANQPGWQVALIGANLAGIEDLYLLRARVWGRVKMDDQGSATIEVERYEKADPNARIQAWLGNLITATVEGKSVVVLQSDDGQQYVLAYSIRFPGDKLAQMGRAIVEGVLRPETFGGYPVIEQASLASGDGVTDISKYTITVQPPRQIRVVPSKGTVEEVELVYLVDDVAQVYVADGTLPTPEPARLIVRPVWRFAGHTERGETFEALVDAIPDSELQKLGISQTTLGVPDAVTYSTGAGVLSVPAALPTPTAAP